MYFYHYILVDGSAREYQLSSANQVCINSCILLPVKVQSSFVFYVINPRCNAVCVSMRIYVCMRLCVCVHVCVCVCVYGVFGMMVCVGNITHNTGSSSLTSSIYPQTTKVNSNTSYIINQHSTEGMMRICSTYVCICIYKCTVCIHTICTVHVYICMYTCLIFFPNVYVHTHTHIALCACLNMLYLLMLWLS